jgi:anthranilate synthase/aminodeoxychorismate synthase-like glutamine amidotransferase
MLLLVDNYDSFTYNLVQAFGSLGAEVAVRRNDALSVGDVETLHPSHLVLSPGPGRPENTGVCLELIRSLAGRVPVLGVCLGHQCIARSFGGRIVAAERLVHGKTSHIHHDGEGIYRGLSNPFVATRYHSLLVEESSLPAGFRVTSRTEHGELMGIRNDALDLEGVQFHPESFLCDEGPRLLRNVLQRSSPLAPLAR